MTGVTGVTGVAGVTWGVALAWQTIPDKPIPKPKAEVQSLTVLLPVHLPEVFCALNVVPESPCAPA